jgi:rhodanese-related sulfurtransferase
MKAMQLIGLSSLLLTSCNQAKEPEVILDAAVQEITAKFNTVPQISTSELAAWLADPNREPPLLLDVREPEEYAVSHLPDAIRISPDASADQLRDKIDLSRPLVLYCSIGYRSSALAEQLIAAGAIQAMNLEGSIFKWANEGRPMLRDRSATNKVHPYNQRFARMLLKPLRAERIR